MRYGERAGKDRVYSYRVSGLAVASEVDLPGLIPGDPAAAPDVTIRRDSVPMTLDDAVAIGPNWQRADSRFLMRVPAIARFLLEDGQRIAFEAEDGAEPQDVAVFLSGSVFGVLLHQRNHIVLHSSAVLVGGKAVLFCGVSGAGKSTLAAALGERGYPLVADDQCAVELDDGVPRIHPDGRQMRLWENSIRELDLVARRGDAMRNRIQKFYVDPVDASLDPVPVGAIYALAVLKPSRAAGIAQPNVVDATKLLIANAYRPALIRKFDQRAAYFRGGTALAQHAGIFTLTRELDFDAIPATIAALEAHWVELGLIEANSEARAEATP